MFPWLLGVPAVSMLASEVDAAAGLCPSDLMDVSSSLVPTSARAGLVEGSVLVALADVAVGEELASLSFSLSSPSPW